MFGELPKLVGRDFAIGFFLPFALLLAATVGLLHAYHLTPQVLDSLNDDLLVGTTIAGVATWLGAVALMGVNRSLYRFFEGYGQGNPLLLLLPLQQRRYDRLMRRIAAANDSPPRAGRRGKIEDPSRLRLELVREFPEREFLLPTRFGNVLRAFEVYPRIMYGIDSIPGWVRLVAVIPKEFLEMVNEARARTDFWVNLWLGGFVVTLEWVAFSVATGRIDRGWLPAAALFVAWAAYRRALSAAMQWGELVKAAFDVFLPDLWTRLGAPLPASKEEQRRTWERFSQAILYRRPGRLPSRFLRSPP
jgi:hypothetical protein